jgi:hypothetical protein
MIKITHAVTLLPVLLFCALQAAPAQAQRVFVSATGSDSNPCTFASPCRSFQQAHNTAAPNGEIDVLDPAGYGALTITKAISIQGHGYSGISVASGATGITINAAATDTVNLNGLLIDGGGIGFTGIKFTTGGSLSVNNCVTRNFTNGGIDFSPTTSTPSRMVVSNSQAYDNSTGIAAAAIGSGAVKATVSDSVVSGNSFIGFYVATGAGAPATLMVVRSVSANNGDGLHALNAGAILRIAQSTVTGNAAGWHVFSGASVFSAGDNTIEDNASNQTAPPAYAVK